MDESIRGQLEALRRAGLKRSLPVMAGNAGDGGNGEGFGDGVWLNFSSNDYLGLSRDRSVVGSASDAVVRWGAGAGASRLMSGHFWLHEALEADLALLVGCEASLVFGSGFMANMGVLAALAGKGDVIFADKLNHASLIDGMRLSGARWVRYRHGDVGHLSRLLAKETGTGRRLIVTESVFSMDGDVADLAGLRELADRYEAMLVVDEAHAIGVMGREGGGVCRMAGVDVRADVVTGTLSKALGGYGGFVGCSVVVREWLVNRARSFVYSTALPPACLAAGRAAVGIVRTRPELGELLLVRAKGLADRLRDGGCDVGASETQIVPVMVGGNDEAMAVSARLREQGILAVAVRPPTVAVGTARLRLSVTLSHSEAMLAKASDAVVEAMRAEGVLVGGAGA